MENQELPPGERIREKIHIETERLKFVQMFFLPLMSGLIALNFTNEQFDIKAILYTAGCVGFIFLYFKRKRNIRAVKKLIDKL